VDDRGPGCPVSEGDVLQLRPGSSNGAAADVVVLASKGMDCRRGSVVSVQIQDLQEMQNHMRETVDQGLAEFQSRQGRGGLPPLPAAAAGAPVASPIAAAVQPDANVATELSQAAQEADSGEQAVVSQSAAADGNAAGPVTISLGQSMADVESMNGKPDKVIDLGAKKIYVYKDLKITFMDGKVSDVQ
jgi:TolA-binding protein